MPVIFQDLFGGNEKTPTFASRFDRKQLIQKLFPSKEILCFLMRDSQLKSPVLLYLERSLLK